MARPRPSEHDLARFWRHVPERPNGECWLWVGNTRGGKHPYGRFWLGRVRVKATHLVWWLETGEWPELPLCILHRCDTPRCVNPDHLFLGTRGDNNRDCTAKARNARGEKHGNSKLTAEEVEAMRAQARTRRQVDLAETFGISQAQVSKIVRGEAWI